MSENVYENIHTEVLETDGDNQTLKPTFFDLLKKIYNFVAKVFLYSVILVMVFLAVLFVTYAIDYVKNISKGNYKPLYGAYVIVSPSMVPTIKVQDAVVVKNVAPEKLRKGDIITFISSDSRYAGLTVTHRIIDIEKSDDGKYLFRTNNNTPDDALVTADNIDGRVFLKIPKIGYLQYFLSQSYGWIICIVIPCLAVIAIEIVKIFKTAQNSVVKRVQKKKEPFKTKKQRNANKVEVITEKAEEEKQDEDDIEVIM